jgi:hypothetical protein
VVVEKFIAFKSIFSFQFHLEARGDLVWVSEFGGRQPFVNPHPVAFAFATDIAGFLGFACASVTSFPSPFSHRRRGAFVNVDSLYFANAVVISSSSTENSGAAKQFVSKYLSNL